MHSRDYITNLATVLNALPFDQIEDLRRTLNAARESGRTVFLFGNGGSAATASHMATDFAKGTITSGRPRLRVVALTDNIPMMTAWANDSEYAAIFAEQLDNLVRADDVVIGISGSGNSPNVVRALRLANERGALSVALTGGDGGKVKSVAQRTIIVPSPSMQAIEDAHLALLHAIFLGLCD